MLVGYVSDERYVAIEGVALEFIRNGISEAVTSRASGAVYADIAPGEYEVVLSKAGFGAKRTTMTVQRGVPHHFRLLADQLLGYPWPKYVQSGEKSEFRVHSPEAFHMELWRYGLKKERVEGLGWWDEHGPRAMVQITPDGDYTQTGVQWSKTGYASPGFRPTATAPEKSGLYYFHASTKSGLFFSFPWIVAPKKPTAKIAVLASNITWNVYNAFGGRSNYINTDKLPETPTVNSRQDLQRYTATNFLTYQSETYAPLSFDRPEPINFVPENEEPQNIIEGRSACHIAPAEWRFLAWLEREGFGYDFWAESQLHEGTLDLDAYKILILSTHPEYWSKEMYFKVKAWVHERGGRLLYLGGNGIDCEVTFEGDAVVCHNGDARRLRQPGKYTPRFRDRVECPSNLLGVVFDYDGAMTGAPYRVKDASHWIYAGTGLKNGDLFGEKSLHMRCPGGASGHETDKVTPWTPKGTIQLAKGENPDNGGADMIYYEMPSGGKVFSAGSIAWNASIFIDDKVSKITRNVIENFLK